MVISLITKRDIKKIEKLHQLCFQTNKNNFISLIMNRHYIGFKIIYKTQYIGYCIINICDNITDICSIAIHPKFQKQGFGRLLLKNVINFIKLKNITINLNLTKINKNITSNIIYGLIKMEKILLEVEQSNQNAIKLYKSLNFQTISIRKNYYGNNKNAIIMMKII